MKTRNQGWDRKTENKTRRLNATGIINNVVRVVGQLCITPPFYFCILLFLYPLRWPWWDTAFHLLIAVIGVCEGEVHVFGSPSASVRELENGILWRALHVCRLHPRWHIFIICSVTEQISLFSGHWHTLWFAIVKMIHILINFASTFTQF